MPNLLPVTALLPKSARLFITWLFTGAALALLGACSTTKVADCNNSKSVYLHAIDHAPLQIPNGLETPDRRNLLTVPPEKTARKANGSCLDQAPSYFGTAGRIAASPEETVADWAQAWADRNADAVVAMYSKEYGFDSNAVPLTQLRTEVADGPAPGARVKSLQVSPLDDDRRVAKFTQQFGANTVSKELTLIRESGVWKIANEKVVTN